MKVIGLVYQSARSVGSYYSVVQVATSVYILRIGYSTIRDFMNESSTNAGKKSNSYEISKRRNEFTLVKVLYGSIWSTFIAACVFNVAEHPVGSKLSLLKH